MKDIEVVNLLHVATYSLISKNNDLSKRSSITKEDLKDQCLILFNYENMKENFNHWNEFFSDASFKPTNIKFVHDRQILDIVVGMNEGIAIVPELYYGSSELDLVKIPIEGPGHFVDFGIIYKQKNANKALTHFIVL